MKNPSKHYLLLIAALSVCFIIGVFIGRIHKPNIILTPQNEISDCEATKQSYIFADTRPYIDGKININAASVDDLMLLPGIGTELAKRIVDYRNESGPFKSVYELSDVQGIGDSLIEKNKEYLTVGG